MKPVRTRRSMVFVALVAWLVFATAFALVVVNTMHAGLYIVACNDAWARAELWTPTSWGGGACAASSLRQVVFGGVGLVAFIVAVTATIAALLRRRSGETRST